MWHVYIIQCEDGSLYTGITNNLEKRLKKHADGKGSKYVRSFLPFELVYKEEVEDKSEALRREAEIKSKKASQKKELIKEKDNEEISN